MQPAPGTLAIATDRSNNAKIGDCATTYAAQTSCPHECVFFDGGGCYAEAGSIGKFVTQPLNRAAAHSEHDELDVAIDEARAILALEVIAGRPLRLHTVGDCRTNAAASVVAAAAREYVRRGGGPVWTYTHAWREVERRSWGCVSVLASCETPLDIAQARARGYATSLTIEEFPTRRRFEWPESGEDVLPCPAQTTGGVACSSCGLCFDDEALRTRGYSIGFAVHGTPLAVKKARLALAAPDDPDRRLTSRDHALRFLDERGRWPSCGELQKLSGVISSSASQMLKRLRAERAAA